MGRGYRQFGLEERIELARLHAAVRSLRQIAATLDRAPSSIARELKRNSGSTVGYKPAYADQQARARRWSGSRLDRDAGLRDEVLGQLAAGWSPEQIAGRGGRIGTETIYRFIHAQIARHKDYSWRRYLPRGKAKRGWRGTRGGSPAEHMSHRVGLADRPAEVADRTSPGHWEADLMAFARYGQNILMLHERMSRALIGAALPSKHAKPVAQAIGAALEPLPEPLRQTVTFDNSLPRRRPGAPSSRATTSSTPSVSPPSSAIPTPPGRKAASRTPSAECGASCQERPISPASMTGSSATSSSATTTRHGSASAGKPQPRPSQTTCCTSNENPHPRLRGDDPVGGKARCGSPAIQTHGETI